MRNVLWGIGATVPLQDHAGVARTGRSPRISSVPAKATSAVAPWDAVGRGR
jgi:hypothetical protein